MSFELLYGQKAVKMKLGFGRHGFGNFMDKNIRKYVFFQSL